MHIKRARRKLMHTLSIAWDKSTPIRLLSFHDWSADFIVTGASYSIYLFYEKPIIIIGIKDINYLLNTRW